MERRSERLYRSIAASPALLLIAVGLVGHVRRSPSPSPARGTATYDAEIMAYRERVAVAQDLHANDDRLPSSTILREAGRWTDGFASGRLVAIGPAAYEDHLQTSVRGEILRTGVDLAVGLLFRADRDLQGGESGRGLSEALTAAQLAYDLRSFDLQSMLQTGVVQRRATTLIAAAWPAFDGSQRREARRRLRGLLVDDGEVERMAARERAQLVDYGRRQRVAIVAVADAMKARVVVAVKRSVATDNLRIETLLESSSCPASKPRS